MHDDEGGAPAVGQAEDLTNLTLESIKDGAVKERFARQLRRVLDNIGDPNTDATATRKLVVTVSLTPNKDRTAADLDTEVDVKLAPPKTIESSVILTTRGNTVHAREPRQVSMFRDKEAN